MEIRKIQKDRILDFLTNKKFPTTSNTPELPNFNLKKNFFLSPQPGTIPDLFREKSEENLKELKRTITSSKKLFMKDIEEGFEKYKVKDPNNFFHRSSNYIQMKQKIKENIRNSKLSKGKLSKIKSIFEPECEVQEFITEDDLLNDKAVEFLMLNKRNFGETRKKPPVFRQKRKTSSEKLTLIKSSKKQLVPETDYVKIGGKSKIMDFFIKNPNKTRRISDFANGLILAEMKKLWPNEIESINEKKRKILQVKISKLKKQLEENKKSEIENEILNGYVTTEVKMKMDKMVDQHLRKLRNRLTVFY